MEDDFMQTNPYEDYVVLHYGANGNEMKSTVTSFTPSIEEGMIYFRDEYGAVLMFPVVKLISVTRVELKGKVSGV